MFRSVILAALLIAGAGAAAAQQLPPQDRRPMEEAVVAPLRDPFVVSSDACEASRYQHLLGREYAQVYEAALLPADSVIQNRHMLRTLQYTPHQLNVVVGGEGLIFAIGCF